MRSSWIEIKKYIHSDIYRNYGQYNRLLFWKLFFSKAQTGNLLIHYRLCHYFISKPKMNIIQIIFYYLLLFRYKRLQIYCGIELDQHTNVGYGLRLPHKGAIVIHPNAVIGNNCEIMSCVTIGNNILKDRDAVAQIGDNVLICSGAKIIGHINIGNNVIIGANSVVNKNIKDGVIIAGVPAKILAENKDKSYLINCE